MALIDQPYLPLYVDDWMNNNKLKLCSASAHGLMISIMCLMHKSEEYGVLKLKAKFKQNESKEICFAKMLSKMTCFDFNETKESFSELIEENVIYIENDNLISARMLKDGNLSKQRATTGSSGGKVGRSSGTKRYYNEPGYLYLIFDKDDNEAFKVGISKEPEKRIKGISRKTGRPNLEFRKRWYVKDMGEMEQHVLDYFNDIRDGEWIYGTYKIDEIETQISTILNKQNESKTKANSVNGIVIENVNEIESKNENVTVIEKPKRKTKNEVSEIELQMPFFTEVFKAQWQLWKVFRSKEHQFHYKSVISEQAAIDDLHKIASGDEKNAIAIIHQSIAKGWKGFFEIKNNNQNGNWNNNNKQSDSQLKASVNDAVDRMFG